LLDQSSNAFANGAVYRLNEANTTFVDAGAVVFGIEQARVNAQALQRRGGPEREYLEGGILAAGVDLSTVDVRAIFFHILGRDRTQYIRLDYIIKADHIDFAEFRWHWHYTPPAKGANDGTDVYDYSSIKTYHYDAAANGQDIWRWWFACLATGLPDMLRQAGATVIADDVDPNVVVEALAEAESIVRERERALTP
jgi:hypothetical protein